MTQHKAQWAFAVCRPLLRFATSGPATLSLFLGAEVAVLPACLGGAFHTTMQQRQSRRPCGSGTPQRSTISFTETDR